MAHLVQAAVWTAGLDDRLTDSGLISFQLCKAYAPPVGVKGQISTVCLYTAGGNLASKDNFILFYLDSFNACSNTIGANERKSAGVLTGL